MASSGKTSQRAQHLECLAARPSSRDAYCIGSNYIWAWENNKIMREAGYGAGGAVFDAVIEQIINSRPNFVFNTLIGVSAYAFFRGFRRSVETHGIGQPRVFPIASCSLAKRELVEIGPSACAGHVSSSVYFESIKTTNLAFVASYGRRFPANWSHVGRC